MNWSGDCQDGLLSGFGTQMWLSAKAPNGKYDARYVTAVVERTFEKGRPQGVVRVNTPGGYFDAKWVNGVFVTAVEPDNTHVANQTPSLSPSTPPAPQHAMPDPSPVPTPPHEVAHNARNTMPSISVTSRWEIRGGPFGIQFKSYIVGFTNTGDAPVLITRVVINKRFGVDGCDVVLNWELQKYGDAEQFSFGAGQCGGSLLRVNYEANSGSYWSTFNPS